MKLDVEARQWLMYWDDIAIKGWQGIEVRLAQGLAAMPLWLIGAAKVTLYTTLPDEIK